MKRKIQSPALLLCLALSACSSDPATFITYTQKTAATGTFDVTRDPKPTDALALNYANSVEEIFRARSTGTRYTREASDTALVGLSAFTGAAESLSISASTLSGMGLAGVGILELRKIFDANGRSNAYFEAAERIHGAIKDFRAHNLNDVSETDLSPNGWTLANVVQANIDIVDKILNGHLPSPAALEQASEAMSADGAIPQRAGTIPVNNLPATSLVSTTANPRLQAAAALQVSRVKAASADEVAELRAQIKKDHDQRPKNEIFSGLMTQIDDSLPADQPEKAKAVYTALLKDPVLKAVGLPATIKPEANDIIRFFQSEATDTQKDKLIDAADHQLKKK
jgi:hypothetical protein